MKVNVTATHITMGEIKDCEYCPIGWAIREGQEKPVSPNLKINVQEDYVTIDGIYYSLPKRAQSFIKKFDNEKPVKPFSFFLTKWQYQPRERGSK